MNAICLGPVYLPQDKGEQGCKQRGSCVALQAANGQGTLAAFRTCRDNVTVLPLALRHASALPRLPPGSASQSATVF